jgi:glycerophosphoryl diester phosphodiesterase
MALGARQALGAAAVTVERFSPSRPLTVAHRAGNDLDKLAAAESAGIDVVEADVWPYRGRLEVRHTKTMGPVPLLWDRWSLEPAWRTQLQLEELLEAASPKTELMLDLKGTDASSPQAIMEAVERVTPGRQYAVCSQSWDLLEGFRDEPHVRVVHSIGNRRALEEVEQRLTWHANHAISVNQKFLGPSQVQRLLGLAPTVMTWPINTRRQLRRVLRWGVNGIISDNPALLAEVVRKREQAGWLAEMSEE